MFSGPGRIVAVLVAAWCLCGSVDAGDPKPAIEDLLVQRQDGSVQVSFRVANGLNPDVMDQIQSGILVRFKHKIELTSRRWFPLPAKVLARAVVETTVEYDALTKRYALERRTRMKGDRKKKEPGPDTEQRVTTSSEEMRRWMTEIREIPVLPGGNTPPGKLKVRVDSTVGRRFVMLIFPSRVAASAEHRLAP